MAKSCPVALPKTIGAVRVFTAHGVEFQLKRVSRNDYFLANNVNNPPRSRWGTARQICEDLRHVFEMGALPVPKTHGF